MADSFFVNITARLPDALGPDAVRIIDYVLGEGERAPEAFPDHVFFTFNGHSVPRYHGFYGLGADRYRFSLSRIKGFGYYLQVSIFALKGVDGYHRFLLFLDWLARLGVADQVLGCAGVVNHMDAVDLIVCKNGMLYVDPKKGFSDTCQPVNAG